MNSALREDREKSAAPRTARATVASVAAIGSVLAASSCCLPILPFVFAAGMAGSSALLGTLRPYLLALSIVLVGYGFYQAWRAKQCRARRSVVGGILLWGSAGLVTVAVLFPQVLANAAANLLTR